MLRALLGAASDLLFELRDLIQLFLVNAAAQFVDQVRVLGGVALALLELREVLNDTLHVLDRLALGLAILVLEEALYERVDGVCHVAEVAVHLLGEELIIVAGEDNLLHVILEAFDAGQINTVAL